MADTIETPSCTYMLEYESRLKVPSSILAGCIPRCEILATLHARGVLNCDEKKRLLVAFQEAVINALEHGNLELRSEWKAEVDASGVDRFSEEKKVRLATPKFAERCVFVTSKYDGELLSIAVRDEGAGYPEDLRQATLAQSDVAPSGRGLALISWAFDEVLFLDDGREIVMKKRIRYAPSL